MQHTPLTVEIWSDVACPWCYIGKRRFEAALARFPQRAEVAVVWRSFELDPNAPAEQPGPYAERLAGKYGTSAAAARQMIDRMTATAAGEGLTLRFDRTRPGNTFSMHRLLHLAAERDCQDAVKERFLAAYLTDGEPVGDPEVLVRLAGESGLDAAEAAAVLTSDRYAEQVRADEAEAAVLGITGVPFFVLDRRYAVSGAQPAELLLAALDRAWADRRGLSLVGAPAGGRAGEGVGDGDSCAV